MGNTFTSWLSADGVTWTKIGSATVTMTNPVTIGLFDTSHNIGALSTAAFDHVQVTGATPPPPPGPPSISLAPVSQSAATGTSQTVTATVVDGSKNPIAGSTVTFNVLSGPDAGQTASAVTDAAGHAAFTVTGTTAGTDTVQASFVDSTATTRTSNSVQVTFTTATTGGVVISNLTVNDTTRATLWSVQPNLQIGDVIYADRTYTLTAAPSLAVRRHLDPRHQRVEGIHRQSRRDLHHQPTCRRLRRHGHTSRPTGVARQHVVRHRTDRDSHRTGHLRTVSQDVRGRLGRARSDRRDNQRHGVLHHRHQVTER